MYTMQDMLVLLLRTLHGPISFLPLLRNSDTPTWHNLENVHSHSIVTSELTITSLDKSRLTELRKKAERVVKLDLNTTKLFGKPMNFFLHGHGLSSSHAIFYCHCEWNFTQRQLHRVHADIRSTNRRRRWEWNPLTNWIISSSAVPLCNGLGRALLFALTTNQTQLFCSMHELDPTNTRRHSQAQRIPPWSFIATRICPNSHCLEFFVNSSSNFVLVHM